MQKNDAMQLKFGGKLRMWGAPRTVEYVLYYFTTTIILFFFSSFSSLAKTYVQACKL